jgi:hypothetical protein
MIGKAKIKIILTVALGDRCLSKECDFPGWEVIRVVIDLLSFIWLEFHTLTRSTQLAWVRGPSLSGGVEGTTSIPKISPLLPKHATGVPA